MNPNIRIELDMCQVCEDKPIMLVAYNRKTNELLGATDMRSEEYEDLDDKIAELEFIAKMETIRR